MVCRLERPANAPLGISVMLLLESLLCGSELSQATKAQIQLKSDWSEGLEAITHRICRRDSGVNGDWRNKVILLSASSLLC
jgi:hypothetical protein